ncbi:MULTISPECIES: hypothetical protein [unclassified Brevundimonas]
MTDEEIRVASLEKLTEERIYGAAVSETTPQEIDALAMAIADALGGAHRPSYR